VTTGTPLRILLVTHYFPPEIGAPQSRLSEFAHYWSLGGETVTVLTGMPNHPTGIVHPGYRGRRRLVEVVAGYRVVRTWLYATPNEGIVRKTLGHLSFMVTAVILGMRPSGPADVVVVSSPTFFSIFSAWVLAKRKRARLVVEVRDLWPAIFVELGVLTDRRVIWVLERLELWAYRTADAVVVVSEGFRHDLVRRGVPGDKVHVIRNGVDLDRFDPATDAAPGRAVLGVPDGAVLALYLGAHGISHGLESVVEAGAGLQAEGVHLAFVGEGSAKKQAMARAADLGTSNVSFHAGVPRGQVPMLIAAADICLVPLRDVPLFASFIPSKIFEYLGAGKAVIGSVAGESAEILRQAGAVVVSPEDPAQLADAILLLTRDPDRRRQMGKQGRRFVEDEFDRRALADDYLRILDACAPRSAVGRGSVG